MKTIRLITVLALLSFFHAPDDIHAEVIHVPGDQPTIQDGIDAAQDGDTVLVSPGTYHENINFNGKDIVVASHFILDHDLSFIASTLIDGSQPAGPDTASCVLFVNGEGPGAVLQGFTITGGTGTHWVDPQFPAYTWHSGGGIFIFQSAPTIKFNYIMDNHVDDNSGVSGASGGGICTYGGNPLICNNMIKYNTALYGAGVVIDYSGCVFKNNVVAHNSGGQDYGGGAFWTIGNGTGEILIENNTIVNNASEQRGGAMYLWSTELTARNNIIWGNTQVTGGPVYLRDGALAAITFSDVEGSYAGEGNIDLPPDFADTSFILDIISPCIDAGNPDPLFNDPEDPAYPGQALWPSHGQLTNDMGAYGGPLSQAMAGTPTGLAQASLSNDVSLEIAVYPNPCSANARLRLKINDQRYLISYLCSIDGRKICSLENKKIGPGECKIEFDVSDLPAGMYFIQLQAGEDVAVKKLVVE